MKLNYQKKIIKPCTIINDDISEKKETKIINKISEKKETKVINKIKKICSTNNILNNEI